jgi:hypothetical protein
MIDQPALTLQCMRARGQELTQVSCPVGTEMSVGSSSISIPGLTSAWFNRTSERARAPTIRRRCPSPPDHAVHLTASLFDGELIVTFRPRCVVPTRHPLSRRRPCSDSVQHRGQCCPPPGQRLGATNEYASGLSSSTILNPWLRKFLFQPTPSGSICPSLYSAAVSDDLRYGPNLPVFFSSKRLQYFTPIATLGR